MSETIKIRKVTTLIIGDVELNCDCKDLTIDDLNITHIGFSKSVIDQFDMIIYSDTRGTKILKSVYTKTGIVN